MEHLRWMLLDKVLVRYLALLKHLIFMIQKYIVNFSCALYFNILSVVMCLWPIT